MVHRCGMLVGFLLFTWIAVADVPAAQNPSRPDSTESTMDAGGGRWDELVDRRQERLDTVHPAKPSKVVDFLDRLENKGFNYVFTAQYRHWLVGIGQNSPVSGIAPSIQYERPRIGSTQLTFHMEVAYSSKNYVSASAHLGDYDHIAPADFMGDGFLGAPFNFDNREQDLLEPHWYLETLYREFPREQFYGLGPDSREEDRSQYSVEEFGGALVGGYPFARWMAVQARIGYLNEYIGDGKGDYPDTRDAFDETSAPGLTETKDYMAFDAGLYFSWEGDPNLPAAGVGLEFLRIEDWGSSRFDFDRYSFDVRGSLPLWSRQRTIAVRLHGASDEPRSGSEVPFYFMRTLGGVNTLRGYRDFRFRDENIFHFSAEYRWEANAAVELALFYDSGKVFSDNSDFNFDDMEESYGFGVRAKSRRRVAMRADIGHSVEGTVFSFSFGPAW